MKINKAFKYRIYPNKAQAEIFAKHFGCTRFVYNHFLRQRIDHYNQAGKGLTYYNNAVSLVQLKKQNEYQWLQEVNSQSLQHSLRNLDTAYRRFFKQHAKFPKFKKKRNKQSFGVPQHFSVTDDRLNIPKCKGIKIVLYTYPQKLDHRLRWI